MIATIISNTAFNYFLPIQIRIPAYQLPFSRDKCFAEAGIQILYHLLTYENALPEHNPQIDFQNRNPCKSTGAPVGKQNLMTGYKSIWEIEQGCRQTPFHSYSTSPLAYIS
jgi:hypothetical protein